MALKTPPPTRKRNGNYCVEPRQEPDGRWIADLWIAGETRTVELRPYPASDGRFDTALAVGLAQAPRGGKLWPTHVTLWPSDAEGYSYHLSTTHLNRSGYQIRYWNDAVLDAYRSQHNTLGTAARALDAVPTRPVAADPPPGNPPPAPAVVATWDKQPARVVAARHEMTGRADPQPRHPGEMVRASRLRARLHDSARDLIFDGNRRLYPFAVVVGPARDSTGGVVRHWYVVQGLSTSHAMRLYVVHADWLVDQ